MNAAEFAALKTQVAEIHLAVVGNGAPGSSMRERMATAETEIAAHKSSHRWSMARGIVMSAATAIASAMSLRAVVGL